MDLFIKVLWSKYHLQCLEISTLVHKTAGIRSSMQLTSLQRYTKNAVQQEGLGGTPREVLSCASLKKAKISKDMRSTSIAQLALQAKFCLCNSVESFLYPPHITCPPQALPQHDYCLSSAYNQPKSTDSQQMQLNFRI